MTDIEKKILKDSVIKIFDGFNILDHTATIGGLRNDILGCINDMPEEPADGDLGAYIDELSKQFPEVSFAKLSRIAVRVAKWQEEQTLSKILSFKGKVDDILSYCDGLEDALRMIKIKLGKPSTTEMP